MDTGNRTENKGTPRLSHLLIDRGFFSALGTTEHVAMQPKMVNLEKPFSYDTNNGIAVVYDECGRPWIIAVKRLKSIELVIANLERETRIKGRLTRGAHVPHSNDGGHYIKLIAEITEDMLRNLGDQA